MLVVRWLSVQHDRTHEDNTVAEQPDQQAIHQAIRNRYTAVAGSAVGKFAYPTGRAGAIELDYAADALDAIPSPSLAAFCGVGNPWILGAPRAGETVLDIGCGAGVDLVIAAQGVGSTGRVWGIDMTPAMARRAQRTLAQMGISHGHVALAQAEALPCATGRVDVVTSNGMLNLSPQKAISFREIWRVLKPGGRLQFADMTLREALPAELMASLDAWSD
jgi:SAM-dependent methyltransferase